MKVPPKNKPRAPAPRAPFSLCPVPVERGADGVGCCLALMTVFRITASSREHGFPAIGHPPRPVPRTWLGFWSFTLSQADSPPGKAALYRGDCRMEAFAGPGMGRDGGLRGAGRGPRRPTRGALRWSCAPFPHEMPVAPPHARARREYVETCGGLASTSLPVHRLGMKKALAREDNSLIKHVSSWPPQCGLLC